MEFRVWAPKATTVELAFGTQCLPMTPCAGGWWRLDVPEAGPNTEYGFSLDGGPPLPNPRSPYQPSGVHGPSRVLEQ
jgi:maltooligosyltrehalose trehalohydrolase